MRDPRIRARKIVDIFAIDRGSPIRSDTCPTSVAVATTDAVIVEAPKDKDC